MGIDCGFYHIMMSSASENNKRIAKNTLLLYVRQFFVLFIGLYTVRIVLDTLGTEDYGLYNIVGGVVALFSFFNSTLAAASQRYFSYGIGIDDNEYLNKIFNMFMIIYFIVSILLLVVAETVGLWFLNNKLVIESSRLYAANWVFQCSILTFIVTTLTIPYNALIIARERMNLYAYLSILDICLKLSIVYVLQVATIDKLIVYSLLTLLVSMIVSSIYFFYCRKHYKESSFRVFWNKNLFKELFNYTSWNLFGSIAQMTRIQGVSILLNLFFGTVVNASQAIAARIASTLNNFVLNFTTAINPQITKYYAGGERQQAFLLAFRGIKISFFLLLLLSIPVIYSAPYLLSLWLKDVPEYTIIFTRLIIIDALVGCPTILLDTVAMANGKIKQYLSVIKSIELLNLPVSYIILKYGATPESVLYVSIILFIISLLLRIFLLNKIVNFPVRPFIKEVLVKLLLVSLFSFLAAYFISVFLMQNIYGLIMMFIISFIATLGVIFTIGISGKERIYIFNYIRTKK